MKRTLVLALLVTPVTYSLFDDVKQWFWRFFRKREEATMHAVAVEHS